MGVLLKQEEKLNDFSQRKQFLIDNELLSRRAATGFSEKNPLRRGLLAYMIYKALGIKGGLTLRLLGPNQRYAHKELVYRGLMVSGSSAEFITGEELVYVFVKATDFLAKNKGK